VISNIYVFGSGNDKDFQPDKYVREREKRGKSCHMENKGWSRIG